MDSRNLLILTVYFIVVTYVFYQAYKSLGSQVVIDFDATDLNNQLQKYNLDNILDVKFKFKSSYRLEDIKLLLIIIRNKSEDSTIRVDWDQSSITDFDNVTERVIRMTPGMTNIPQAQAVSIIVPNQIIEEELSNDKAIAGSLFKPEKLRRATEASKPFYLRLLLTISSIATDKQSYTLSCQLFPRKLRWTKALSIALIPKPKK